MRQNAPRLLFHAAGIATLLVSLEPMTCYTQPASAATDGNTDSAAAAPQPSLNQTGRLPAPMLRLLSEMPTLRQLVTPSRATPAPIPPAISTSPTTFSFTVQRGGGNPTAQRLNIRNTGGGTLTWTASDNAAWLTLSPASGTNDGAVTVSPATGLLAVGTYNGTITISAPETRSVSVPVIFTVTAASVPPAIGTSPASLSFTAQHGGGNPAAQTLNISNTGGGTLTWTASDNAAWLALSPASGINNGTITVSAATGALTAGTYNATVALGATGAANVQVPVTFTVTPAPTSITLSPSSLTYTGVQGGSTPASQGITVTSNGNWTANNNATWLTLSPASGSGNGTISARVNLESASVGTNKATITVTAGGTTRAIEVTLVVAAASLTVTPGNLAFTATQGGANPSAQTITLSSTGTWTASDNASWLSLSPTSGSNNGKITASVNTANANPGNNSATITVTSGGITKTATVTLTLNAPSSSSATLTWNANTESDLAGYKVYRATASGAYGAPIATVLRNVTTYQAIGLQFGTTYFFVVTAFDVAGNESAYSNEVSKSIF
jgi:hypothetical protein